MSIKATLITKNNDLKNVNINPFRLEDYVENKGKNAIEQLHIFNYDNLKVIIYGWTEGKENQINRHELPEPIENTLFYGDLLVLLRENDELVDFPKEEYEEFYDYIFGGFDSCDENDDEDLEDGDYDYDDDFIVRG